jgi:hypothetical protein
VIEYVGRSHGEAVFMRREDIARHWLANHNLFQKGA